MGSKKRLLIVNPKQFGYHLDTYHYCNWASSDFEITYQGFDAGKSRLDSGRTAVRYVSREGAFLVRYFRFLRSCAAEIRDDHDVVFIKYFPGCSLLRLLYPRRRLILDIRSAGTASHPLRRRWYDRLLRWESRRFRHVTIISRSLAEKLGCALDRVHLLPIVVDSIDVPNKDFTSLHLLYVGTLSGRRIDDTILGLHQFYLDSGGTADVSYEIVGDGDNGELDQLRTLVNRLGLNHVVSLPGYVHRRDLAPYYRRCNVGIAYVPINDMYDCQPPRKTLEYLSAGMPVLATKTRENASLITQRNGVLIDDTPQAFQQGLRRLMGSARAYRSEDIRRGALRHSWQAVVQSNLVPYVKSVIES